MNGNDPQVSCQDGDAAGVVPETAATNGLGRSQALRRPAPDVAERHGVRRVQVVERRELLRALWQAARFLPLGGTASVALAACGGGSGDDEADPGNAGGRNSPPPAGGSSSTSTTTSSTTTTTTTVPDRTTTTSTTLFRPTTTTTQLRPTTTTSTSTSSSSTSSTTQLRPTTSTTSSSTSTTSTTVVQPTTTTTASSSTTSSSTSTTSTNTTSTTATSTSTTSTSSSTTTTTAADPGPAPGAVRAFSYLGPNSVNLTASSGMMGGGPTITMSDGNGVRVWTLNGAASGFNNDRIVPGPVIELTQGQAAAITLSSAMPHTIHPHGLDVDTANDGVPQTSGYVSMMGRQAPGEVGGSLGSPFTYRFTAPFAGTYLYHCHQDAALHFEMGMYGAVIVRPPNGATNVVWSGGPSFQQEYIWQLHTFDSRWHTAGRTGTGTLRYRPDYFMINGRDGAALLNDAATAISGDQSSRVLLRLISYGYMPATVELGGIPFDVVASDGRPLKAPMNARTQWRILPGERYDVLFTLPAAGVRQATVTYQNIRGTAMVGTAQTSITSL